MRFFIRIVTVGVLTVLFVLSAVSQTATKSWIFLDDEHGVTATLQFGEDSSATFGTDLFLIENPECCFLPPPFPCFFIIGVN
jgi:hypothetical protein